MRKPPVRKTLLLMTACAATILAPVARASAADIDIPVLVPITGFLALEGTSQRNSALLALRHAPEGIKAGGEVIDGGPSRRAGVTALERAAGRGKPVAVAASMLGTQMLAMLP